MDMTLEERLERLLKAYSHHYDIERDVQAHRGSGMKITSSAEDTSSTWWKTTSTCTFT